MTYGATPGDWQHLDLVLGLGEDLLPVVSNPNATIDPESSMKGLGKTPSRYNGNRRAVGFAQWTQHKATPSELARWSKESDYGICIQTRRLRAIDIDVDGEQARAIREHISARLGYNPPRRSRNNSAKCLLVFEFDGDLTKRKFQTAEGIVELLATGQQFIAVGTHTSGSRYEWEGGLPNEVPVLTLDQVNALWASLVKEFAVEGSHESSASVRAQKLSGVVSADPVAQYLMNKNLVKRAERDGRLHITCPWEHDHTSDSGDTATTYWPAHTGGYANGHFHCLHAHCEHRTDQEFKDAVEYRDEALYSEFERIQGGDYGRGGDAGIPNSKLHSGSGEYAAEFQDISGSTSATARSELDVERGAIGPIDGQRVSTSDERNADNDGFSRNDRDKGGSVPAARFAVQPAYAFAQGRPPSWLIKHFLPKAELAVLFGESGSGKSFLALDLAVAISRGEAWRGRTVRKGRVVYIAAEGAGGFRNRLKAIAQQRDIPLDQIAIGVIADAPNMMEKADALDVARAIQASGGADLVIVDTWAQVTPGSNENSGEDMGRALAHCKGIHRATGALVMLVHHSGKDTSRGARGWSGLRAAADAELEVLRNGNHRSVTLTKLKDGGDSAEFGFQLENVVLGLDEDGEEITSCVVAHTDAGAASRSRDSGPKGDVQKIIMACMLDMVGLGDSSVDRYELKTTAINQLAFDPNEGKKDRRGERVDRAIESLVACKRLLVNGTKMMLSGSGNV